jgi:hypothetical protein
MTSLSLLEFLCGISNLSNSFIQTLSFIPIKNHVIFSLNTIKKSYNQTYLPSSSYQIASLFGLTTQSTSSWYQSKGFKIDLGLWMWLTLNKKYQGLWTKTNCFLWLGFELEWVFPCWLWWLFIFFIEFVIWVERHCFLNLCVNYGKLIYYG